MPITIFVNFQLVYNCGMAIAELPFESQYKFVNWMTIKGQVFITTSIWVLRYCSQEINDQNWSIEVGNATSFMNSNWIAGTLVLARTIWSGEWIRSTIQFCYQIALGNSPICVKHPIKQLKPPLLMIETKLPRWCVRMLKDDWKLYLTKCWPAVPSDLWKIQHQTCEIIKN